MSEVIKDCVIKLFGKTITFPPEEVVASDVTLPEQQLHSSSTPSISSQDVSEKEITNTKHDDESINPTEETLTDASNNTADSKTSKDKIDSSSPHSPEEDEPSESSVSEEKELKKPDKILPCPRCSSMETKFCYFNNYNVNQPRHFCKNCQRYWTAGGTMRNVPVGSGRRKNKNASVRNYSHLMVLDEFKAARADSVNGIQFSPLKPNGFLIFGSDGQMGSPEPMNWEQTNRSSAAASRSTGKGNNDCIRESGTQIFQDMPPPGPNWPYQCKSAAFGGVPVTFYPSTTYWSCPVPSPWNGPCVSPSSSSGISDMCSSPTSNLGKHFREENTDGPSSLGKENLLGKTSGEKPPVLFSKTLKIDDPNEAAKSSSWSTLGSKNKKIGSINGTSLFKAFEAKGDRNRNLTNSMMVMRANPAALSRSVKFHEST